MSYMKRHLEEWVATATIDDIVAAGYDLEDAITILKKRKGRPKGFPLFFIL